MGLPDSILGSLGQATSAQATNALSIVGNPWVLGGAIVLIVAAILLVLLLKRIIINSVLGIVVWAIVKYVFGISLPFWASLIVSVIFGLAGIGVMLALKFLGLF